jgi:hypothetical protein
MQSLKYNFKCKISARKNAGSIVGRGLKEQSNFVISWNNGGRAKNLAKSWAQSYKKLGAHLGPRSIKSTELSAYFLKIGPCFLSKNFFFNNVILEPKL